MQKLAFAYRTAFKKYLPRFSSEVKVIVGDTDKMNNRITFAEQKNDVVITAICNGKAAFKGDYETLCNRLVERKVYVVPIADCKKNLLRVNNEQFMELVRDYGTTLTFEQVNNVVQEYQLYTIEHYRQL